MDKKLSIWVLTEEKPKAHIIEALLAKLDRSLYKLTKHDELLTITPIFAGGIFTHTYKLNGMSVNDGSVLIKVVSGESSFVDYLLYESEFQPLVTDTPLLIAEVTKTDDSESRNTGVNQRATKFIYANKFYPNVPKYMMFDVQVMGNDKKSPTYIYGSKCFRTLGIEIISPKAITHKPFKDIIEMVSEKLTIKAPPKGNVPTSLSFNKKSNTVFIGARLVKDNTLGHDPNIGFVSLTAGAIRKLGFKGQIVIINHGLPAGFVLRRSNKFAYVADMLNLSLSGVIKEEVRYRSGYWKYELGQEKHATILSSIISENIGCEILYENHGGTERGYLYIDGVPNVVEKYTNREAYKAGDKNAKLALPDLVFKKGNHIFIIEGKKYSTLNKGLEELPALKDFKIKLERFFPDSIYTTCLILGGAGKTKKAESVPEVFLHLEESGEINYGAASLICNIRNEFELFSKNV